MVEAQRTYRLLNITELARCVGCLSTSSGWFKHSEPQRTYTILTITELARCVGCLCTSSGWFKHSEPQRTYTNHTITERARCVGCFCTSSGGSSTSNLHEPHHHHHLCGGVFPVGSKRFDVLQQPRTSALHTLSTVLVWFV